MSYAGVLPSRVDSHGNHEETVGKSHHTKSDDEPIVSIVPEVISTNWKRIFGKTTQ